MGWDGQGGIVVWQIVDEKSEQSHTNFMVPQVNPFVALSIMTNVTNDKPYAAFKKIS